MKRNGTPASPSGRSSKDGGSGKAKAPKVSSPRRGSPARGGRGGGRGAGASVAAASRPGGGGGAAANAAGGGGGRGAAPPKPLPTAEQLLKEIAEYQAHLVTMGSRNHQGVSGRWNGPDTTRRFAIEQMVIPRLSMGILPDKHTHEFIFGEAVPSGNFKTKFDRWARGVREDPRKAGDPIVHADELRRLLDAAARRDQPHTVAQPHHGRPNLSRDPYSINWRCEYQGKTLREAGESGTGGVRFLKWVTGHTDRSFTYSGSQEHRAMLAAVNRLISAGATFGGWAVSWGEKAQKLGRRGGGGGEVEAGEPV